MSNEIWRPVFVEGYDVYEVSTHGKCRNTRTGRILKPEILRNGYLRFALCVDGKVKRIMSHRMVAKTFIPNNGNKDCINHIDGDKSNNVVHNLEWASQSENQLHAVQTGLQPVGSKVSYSKLTESDIHIIRYLAYKEQSNVQIAERFGVTASLIGQIKRRKWWKHVDDEILYIGCSILERMVDIFQKGYKS